MAPWQLARVSVLFDGEPPGTIGTLEVLEPIDRYSGGSGGKLEEAGFLFRGPRAKDLPKPGDDLVFFIVATVVGKLGPIIPEEKWSEPKKSRRSLKKSTHISISVIPPIKSSSSLSSNTLMRALGITSKKPSMKASNCSLTRPMIL